MTPPPARDALALLVWLGATFAAGAIGGMASSGAGEFYQTLSRPAWAPPPWVFGPVWTVLYALMGISAWLVWRQPSNLRLPALAVFAVQLAANGLWTWLFFRWRNIDLALAEIVLLLGLIAATLRLFWIIRPLAGVLLLPYFGWTAFAAALTARLRSLNPDFPG